MCKGEMQEALLKSTQFVSVGPNGTLGASTAHKHHRCRVVADTRMLDLGISFFSQGPSKVCKIFVNEGGLWLGDLGFLLRPLVVRKPEGTPSLPFWGRLIRRNGGGSLWASGKLEPLGHAPRWHLRISTSVLRLRQAFWSPLPLLLSKKYGTLKSPKEGAEPQKSGHKWVLSFVERNVMVTVAGSTVFGWLVFQESDSQNGGSLQRLASKDHTYKT